MEKAKARLVLDELCQSIGGDWLLIGGTLVQLWYNGARSTEDIDLLHIAHSSKSKELAQNDLFRFSMSRLGIGPEEINLSCEFFVKELAGWEEEIILFQMGAAGRIFRPSLTLFCALKARRGSELDWEDVSTALKKEEFSLLKWERLLAWLSPDQLARLKAFQS